MKTLTIIVTKKDAEKTVRFYQFWVGIFILVIVYGIFTGNVVSYFSYCFIGLLLALIFWYFNDKGLKTKGNIASKTITDVDNFKNSLLYCKVFFVFWLICFGSILFILTIRIDNLNIGFLSFFIFVLSVFYRRIKILSSFLKKNRIR
jgi:uncharacterized membrane protein